MDECENLVIDLEEYEALDIKQQHILNDNEILELTESLDTEVEMGQAESKKNSKKQNVGEIQTKGTAMSFGFRKNLNTTPKKLKKLIKGENSKNSKKQDKYNANDSDNAERTVGGGVGCEGGSIVDKTPNKENDRYKADTVIDTSTSNTTCTEELVSRDKNGNADLLNNVHFEKMGAAAAATLQTNLNTAAVNAANCKLPGAGNRFGFRGSYRPSSTDITSRQQRESHDNVENNNYGTNGNNDSNNKGGLVSNLKRRSKSAHAGRITSSSNESDSETSSAPRNTQTKTITFNLKQNSTIEYDRRQFFEQPAFNTQTTATTSGNILNARASQYHNNVIVRPTPKVAATAMATAYSKFTLQTVSLPKPEFAVAISINATTPTPANSTYVSSAVVGSGTSRTRDHSSSGRHPLGASQPAITASQGIMDAKQAKHMTNSTRRTFSGSREISADSGIASIDMALDSSTSSGAGSAKPTSSPKRSRSRPRNLQMVMNGRHRFEVKDLDDSLSSESSSIVEPLALPKLPGENQTVPLPLSGLIRSNTVLSRESYELRNSVAKHKENTTKIEIKPQHQAITGLISRQSSEENSESVDEEKLHLDRSATEKSFKFKDINTCSSKNSSPGSSVISSWCNAGESLAANDFSNFSFSSSEDSNKQDNKIEDMRKENENKLSFDLNDEDLITLNTDAPISTLSLISEPAPLNATDEIDKASKVNTTLALFDTHAAVDIFERPKFFCNKTKFAEMALEGSTFLLDDETSPTDSLVSSTESEEACKQKKHKINEELQEKDIDEISPELDLASPISPGTPTHASHSLSLSDCGNLIDDEIADQPALLFIQESQDGVCESGTSRRDKTDTPTLMESMGSMRASINKSRSALHQAMELSLRTPLSLRKAVMERAESLDTLSPCESICSDDLMVDFDVASSMDSIDRSISIKSRSGSDLNNIDENELFSEFDRKGSDVMKELNSILRTRSQKNNDKDITAHLPARATRLLNRTRMQQHCTLNNDDSDSAKSPLTARRRTNTTSSRASTASSTNNNNSSSNNQTNNSANSTLQRKFSQNHHYHHHHHQTASSFHQRDTHSSSDDLMLYDKSFRNAMIQDVLQFKKQLLRLRKILQETETLNPFENDNGQLFASCGLDSKLLDDIDLASLTSSTTDDPIQELADLRRQVVYLQGQVDDRDRTIRLQKNLIEKLEAEKLKAPHAANEIATKECVDTATQTERTRPLTVGTESLSRSKPEYTSYTTYFPAICSDSTTIIKHHQQNPACLANNQTRRHTIISTTLTNYNQQLSTPRYTPRRASIAWEKQTPSYKPVKITLIGDPLKHWQSEGNSLNTNKDDEISKNFLNTNFNRQQKHQKGQQMAQQENAHNNIILNGKHHNYHHNNHQRLQDIIMANEIKSKTFTHQHQRQHNNNHNNISNNNQHHYNHNQMNEHHQKLQQQQQQPHQFYKTATHQHNNLQPTVTIV